MVAARPEYSAETQDSLTLGNGISGGATPRRARSNDLAGRSTALAQALFSHATRLASVMTALFVLFRR